MRPETVAIHGGYRGDPVTRSVAVPIYQTAAYSFDSAEHGAALFNLEVEGHIYTRLSNPTTAVLEARIAALESGVAALVVSSGAAALNYAILNLCEAGTNIVTTPHLYGATFTFFTHILPKLGIEVRFAKTDEPAEVEALINQQTRAVFCESVSNPAATVADVEGLAEGAHRQGVPLIVDNTVATPVLLRPIEHGADVVLHSLTKFIGGHGTTVGGAIVDSGKFPWRDHHRRFPMMSEPEPAYHGVIYTEQYGAAAYIARCRTVCLRNTGSALSPIAAFLLLQGLETLSLRVERHVQNARQVAEHLRRHPRVDWVNYLGFPDNPYHALARRYLGEGGTSLVMFGVAGGFEAGREVFNALRLFTRLVNLGDAKSLATHPASTTHRQLTPDELARVGVTPEMIRLSVGLEHIDDIIDDLDQALAAGVPCGFVNSGAGEGRRGD
ncbi:MAG: aminotransferase class V-fold PLP-dependent enzyme [Acetobacteraceae bacterium]|nr:aminotransferase class V-fold PLP-dependent enzyme [Acetobacteraceae bacterium]